MNEHWENYKKLESLPDNLPESARDRHGISRWFKGIRQSLANTLVQNLSHERQIEHGERCLVLDGANPPQKTQISEFMLAERLAKSKQAAIALLTGNAKAKSQIQSGRVLKWSWFQSR
jgi:hypothetical protein